MHVLPRGRSAPLALTIDDLRVERNGRLILDGVSLTLERGSVSVIIGPSGAGKTTLIRAINGLAAPAGGVICAPGIGALDDATQWARIRRTTATIFQDHALIGRLNALDNVLLGLADTRHALSLIPWRPSARDRAARALADVGLLDRAFQRVDKLSGGERQRVGVARALVRGPEMLLGDEPFSSLDPSLARRLGEYLRALATRDGVTVALVMHQIHLAREIADRIIGVKAGRLIFDGPTESFDATAEAAIFATSVIKPENCIGKGG
ncbi:ATP-binding cassette domain-containing protein [Methylocystis heyeri]|uniref:ATP-binding cassette domain-containing protein n=2 Tax=Methylocystis heyeri TaxID=391905 RepID=A0A6B8KK01_9HYPH|nr:ATP-binding cassette domain-containing protein [Methylocystis heyeri]